MQAQYIVDIELHEATRERFLNYAVSVITSRALPDVRDGLKPVQRRILYTMFHDLRLSPEKSTLKCAKVVGLVLGNYHPHGDGAVYEAMVRLAQPWVMRYPLIFGQGNFGSLDGDSPAAYRYTEAKLTAVAMEFVQELGQETVDMRRNFDDSQDEPVVLPARIPQLLVNGCTGIAVGVATNIPPHNLAEVCQACENLIDNPQLTVDQVLQVVQGPDFPTGGEILEDRASLVKLYSEGSGRIRLRGQYSVEDDSRRGRMLVLTSIPYMVNKSQLVEEIAEHIINRKLPHVLDIRDESTDDVRIVMECKRDADPQLVMGYLYKNTQLQTNFHLNLTCLIPEPGAAPTPRRISLLEALRHFLDFRFEVVQKRLSYDLRALQARLHLLEGFAKVFADLDTAIQIIRDSTGRSHAAQGLIARFGIDQDQAEAVLDLRLYKIGKTDIEAVQGEYNDKRMQVEVLQGMLASPRRLWNLVKKELKEVRSRFPEPRRTQVVHEGVAEIVVNAEDMIVEEEALVLLSRDGWVRRVSAGTDPAKAKLRTDDQLVEVLKGTTKSTVVFLSNLGTAYTTRIHDLQVQPRGFGDPVQKLFSFNDGERVVAALCLDPTDPDLRSEDSEVAPPLHLMLATSEGRGYRISLQGFCEPSTRSGRRYAKPPGGVEIVKVALTRGTEALLCVSRGGRSLLCPIEEVSFLNGASKGVTLIKLEDGDRLLTIRVCANDSDGCLVQRSDGGKEIWLEAGRLQLVGRAGKGSNVIKRGQLVLIGEEKNGNNDES
ncbi:DNA topoisomerase IV subunit A [bacterium]|nr:DNA topoisomerase IV subunit A [bacterium]